MNKITNLMFKENILKSLNKTIKSCHTMTLITRP